MPRVAREMSAAEVRQLDRTGDHAVGGVVGLLLQVTENGARSWILRTTIAGKRRSLGLGPFPEVPLKDARAKARALRDEIREGGDPLERRRAAKQALLAAHAKRLTFADAARRKHEAVAPQFRNARARDRWIRSLELYAFPKIGDMEVADVEMAHVLSVLEPIWQTKTETATRVRQRIEAALSWATVSGYREGPNPAEWKGRLAEVLPQPAKIAKVQHQRALPYKDVPPFMARLRERGGSAARALEFAILTAARSGEVRNATWDEIDFEGRIWAVPEHRTKMGRPHHVPLSDDALALLRALPRFEGDNTIFAAPRGGALSDMAMSSITRKLDVDAVPHGFRSSFKDWARSCSAAADEVSELALAHVSTDGTRAAYARDELLPQRARMMKQWAQFCAEGAAQTAKVSTIGEAKA